MRSSTSSSDTLNRRYRRECRCSKKEESSAGSFSCDCFLVLDVLWRAICREDFVVVPGDMGGAI